MAVTVATTGERNVTRATSPPRAPADGRLRANQRVSVSPSGSRLISACSGLGVHQDRTLQPQLVYFLMRKPCFHGPLRWTTPAPRAVPPLLTQSHTTPRLRLCREEVHTVSSGESESVSSSEFSSENDYENDQHHDGRQRQHQHHYHNHQHNKQQQPALQQYNSSNSTSWEQSYSSASPQQYQSNGGNGASPAPSPSPHQHQQWYRPVTTHHHHHRRHYFHRGAVPSAGPELRPPIRIRKAGAAVGGCASLRWAQRA